MGSGIIYIEVPDHVATPERIDGDLFFEDPRSNLFDNDMHLPFAQFNEPLRITPNIGDTVLFPSWLRHWTAPSYTSRDELRIMFAFNVRIRTQKQENTKTNKGKKKKKKKKKK